MKSSKLVLLLMGLLLLTGCSDEAGETKTSAFAMDWNAFAEHWNKANLPEITDVSSHDTLFGTRYNARTEDFLISAETDKDGRIIEVATVGMTHDNDSLYKGAISMVQMADATLSPYETEQIALETLGLDGGILESKPVSYFYNGLSYEAEYDDAEGPPLLKVSVRLDDSFVYR